MRKILLALVLAVVFLGGFFLLRDRDVIGSGDGEKLKVITTFLPMYVFTANVAGDFADVENLLPPGAGPHEYSFTPGDVRNIAEADVIVMNGLGLEEWMDGVIAQSGTKAAVIVASEDVATREVDGAADPHVWLDPVRAKQMVANIAEGLALRDPEHAETYRANAGKYQARLDRLHDEIGSALAPVPNKAFIAFHPAFGYFAERYGLESRAVIEEFPGKEPGAAYLAEVVELIRREKIRAIFSEPQFSPRVVQTVAKETGLTVRELDTAETGKFAPDTYEEVMRRNLQTLLEAFTQ